MTARPQYLHELSPEQLKAAAAAAAEQYLARLREREAFAQGETFARMLSALRDVSEPLAVDEESLAYYPQETKARVGWDFATEADVRLFIDIVADPQAATVEPGSMGSEDECSFPNCSFRHHGLNVWMMFGQGTAVSVYNDAARDENDAQ